MINKLELVKFKHIGEDGMVFHGLLDDCIPQLFHVFWEKSDHPLDNNGRYVTYSKESMENNFENGVFKLLNK